MAENGFTRRGWLLLLMAVALSALGAFVVTRDAGAAFPGTNGRIVFESNAFDGPPNDSDIFIVNPDGTGQRQLTDNLVDDVDAAISPDGCLIVFSRDVEGSINDNLSGNGDLFLIRPDGTGERQLTGAEANDTNNDIDPTFSPDGERIVFIRDGDIHIIEIATGQVTQVTNNNAFEFVPVFSPDGQSIAFSRFVIDPGENQGDDEIFIINLATGQETRLTDNAVQDRFTDFSPDGQRIVFESNRDGDSDIFTMNVDGTNVTQITNDPAFDSIPVFSPDGRQIAFASNRTGTLDIFLTNADGSGGATQVSQNVPGAFDPNFGPASTPNAQDDSATTREDQAVNVNVLNNDSDCPGGCPGGDLTVRDFTQPRGGEVTRNSDGTLRFTPDRNFNGTTTFTYTVTNDCGNTDTAVVTIRVTAVADPPPPQPPTPPTPPNNPPAPDDCRPAGEGETFFGTPGKDVMRGTPRDDTFFGFGGADTIYGGNGEDTVIAHEGDDTVRGGPCADSIKANDGRNRVYGEGGNDAMDGGNNADLIVGGGGKDSLLGLGGTDRLYARDGVREAVNGGSGRDQCAADRRDATTGCP